MKNTSTRLEKSTIKMIIQMVVVFFFLIFKSFSCWYCMGIITYRSKNHRNIFKLAVRGFEVLEEIWEVSFLMGAHEWNSELPTPGVQGNFWYWGSNQDLMHTKQMLLNHVSSSKSKISIHCKCVLLYHRSFSSSFFEFFKI